MVDSCNFFATGAYLLALEGLKQMKAAHAEDILQQAYAVIEKYENDDRIQELWDIAGVLTEAEPKEMNRLDSLYWENADNIMEKMLDSYAKSK